MAAKMSGIRGKTPQNGHYKHTNDTMSVVLVPIFIIKV
jgi:hypothetical protein